MEFGLDATLDLTWRKFPVVRRELYSPRLLEQEAVDADRHRIVNTTSKE
ncbi:MAG: hypothetical protein JO068_15495 [Hyphomicrobiales bacterium]|nr:hypothetical protein [Hyphomicrobiales bacterium]